MNPPNLETKKGRSEMLALLTRLLRVAGTAAAIPLIVMGAR